MFASVHHHHSDNENPLKKRFSSIGTVLEKEKKMKLSLRYRNITIILGIIVAVLAILTFAYTQLSDATLGSITLPDSSLPMLKDYVRKTLVEVLFN